MLRYYSYYSVGGYKDFILGNNSSKEAATFYFPLLPILEERAKEDEEIAIQVKELKSLPSICQLSADNTYRLPMPARTMFSHAGYKLLYKHLEGEYYALAMRDIPNSSTDEHGRSIPFLFVIVGDCQEDMEILNLLTSYFAGNVKTTEKKIAECLYFDIAINGLKFELSMFNEWITDIVNKNCTPILPTMKGSLDIHIEPNKVGLLILPEGISEENTIIEQKLETMEIMSVREAEIISKENPERLVKQMMALADELKNEQKKNILIKKGVIAAGIGGFLAGALLAGCCHK